MPNSPLISLILCVKNGMPYLPEAVASVAAQTYPDYELIVQDGGSTDGTLEFLHGLNYIPNIQIQSAADAGIGQAYNRAIQRCSGEIIGSIDSDNLLEREALAAAVECMESQPSCAAIYGASKIIDSGGQVLKMFEPGPFDLPRLMKCDLVPPFGQSFFNRKICAEQLRFDESLKTCADFDLWLRISHLPIVMTASVLGSTRVSEKSMTHNPEVYEQFCKDKITALENYLKRFEQSPFIEVIYKLSVAGIYSWAAESVLSIEGRSAIFESLYLKAVELDPCATSLRKLHSFSSMLSAIKDVYEGQPVFTYLEKDITRNLRSEGKSSRLSQLRIAVKFLLNRYPGTCARNLNPEARAYEMTIAHRYPLSDNNQ